MRSKWFVGYASPFAFVAAALIGALPVSAQICGPTTTSYAPAYNTTYAPAYSTAYTPSYAPAYSGAYALPAAEPVCPVYSTGQWIWTGSTWFWCPATAFAPVGESALVGYYGIGAPVPPPTVAVAPTYYSTSAPALDLALGLTSLALMAQQPVYTSAYPYATAYSPFVVNPAFAPIPVGVSTVIAPTGFTTVTNVRNVRTVTVVRTRAGVTNRVLRARIEATHDRLAAERGRVEALRDRLATLRRNPRVNRDRIVDLRQRVDALNDHMAVQRARIEADRDRMTARPRMTRAFAARPTFTAPRALGAPRSFVAPRAIGAPRTFTAPRMMGPRTMTVPRSNRRQPPVR